jgi:hypothetical protein
MDAIIQSKHLNPAVRRALKNASTIAETGGLRVVPMKGGFRLQSSETIKSSPSASAGYRRNGPVRIGVMGHLGLKLDD